MGEALIKGMLRADVVTKEAVWMADADPSRLESVIAELDVAGASNVEAVSRADTVIVAVKPQFVSAVLKEISPALGPDDVVISIAAGVRINALERDLPENTAVVRAMPNTPALIGSGATALAAGSATGPNEMDIARRVFAAAGTTVVVPETLMDAVTGLSGSGPAYVYMFIEALADGGVHAGLPRDVALQLAAQTVLGGAKMVLETGLHPGRLKDMVTSPGGTTITGVAALEERGLRAACIGAVAAATERSRQLGRGQEDGSR